MVRSFIKSSAPLLFALCAGCGAEDMGPVDGEEVVDSVEEALGGNWVTGTGTGMAPGLERSISRDSAPAAPYTYVS
jgi:hypothetical protein